MKDVMNTPVSCMLDCYMDGVLQFESADIIEIEPNVLLAVMSNNSVYPGTSNLNTPYYCVSKNAGLSWSMPKQMEIPNPNNWKFRFFNLLKMEADNIIFMVMQRVAVHPDGLPLFGAGKGGTPAISESHDNGLTWTNPSLVNFSGIHSPVEEDMIVISSRNIMQTTNGRIVIPVASNQADAKVYTIYKDKDDFSWHKSNFLSENGSAGGFAEPTIAQLNDGRLIMLIRTKLGYIYRSYSDDYGKSWSPAQPTTLQSPWTTHSMRITEEGYLIVAFTNDSPDSSGSRYPRTNITTSVSKDDGATWSQYCNIVSSQMVMKPSLTLFGNKILITFAENDALGQANSTPAPLTIQTQLYDSDDLIKYNA